MNIQTPSPGSTVQDTENFPKAPLMRMFSKGTSKRTTKTWNTTTGKTRENLIFRILPRKIFLERSLSEGGYALLQPAAHILNVRSALRLSTHGPPQVDTLERDTNDGASHRPHAERPATSIFSMTQESLQQTGPKLPNIVNVQSDAWSQPCPSHGYAASQVAENCAAIIPKSNGSQIRAISSESTISDIDDIGCLLSSSNPLPDSAPREYLLILPESQREYAIVRPANPVSGTDKSSISHPIEPQASTERKTKPKCQEELNWCSFDELQTNRSLLSEEKQALLSIVSRKRDYMEEKRPDLSYCETDPYFRNILPIVLSGFSKSGSITYCCRNKKPCHSWMFCSTCSKFRANDGEKRLLRAFPEDTFLFLTCSFDGDIPLSASNNRIQQYWQAVNKCLRSLISGGIINGCYIGHEVKIRSFMPARVLPHSHALITTSEDIEVLRALIHERLAADEEIALPPSIRIETIERAEFAARIRYITKPIDLKEPYDSAFGLHAGNDASKIMALNCEMKNTIDALAAAALGFDRIVSMGNLRSQNSRSYIGEKLDRKPAKKKPNNSKKNKPAQNAQKPVQDRI